MILLNAIQALKTLIEIMALPAAVMAGIGCFMSYKGWQHRDVNRSRSGKMLLMFGVILLVIVIILSWFFAEMGTDKIV